MEVETIRQADDRHLCRVLKTSQVKADEARLVLSDEAAGFSNLEMRRCSAVMGPDGA